MARFDVEGLAPLIKDMREAGELTGEVADNMLMSSAEIVKQCWLRAAQRKRHRRTGDMIDSIGYANQPTTIDGVRCIDIYPQGTDRKGARNAEKAFVLHYGRGRLTGSKFVDIADKAASPKVQENMEKIWTEHLKEKGLM